MTSWKSLSVLLLLLHSTTSFSPCQNHVRHYIGNSRPLSEWSYGTTGVSQSPFPVSRLSSKIALLAKKKSGKSNANGSSSSGSGKGFGNVDKSKIDVIKTYGSSSQAPIADLIDEEASMKEFFGSNEEWHPLFRSIATNPNVPAMSFLNNDVINDDGKFESEEGAKTPWMSLPNIPTGDENMAIIAQFLDSSQQALVDIPVTAGTKQDDNDLHFIEEGRRMLVVSRFQVLPENTGGTVQHFDQLFSTCWSEIRELMMADEPDTGSIILVPQYDMSDLKRFTDMNILRPLEWLGVDRGVFEVTSMQRDSCAIRLIHRLGGIPDLPDKPQVEKL